MIYIKNHSESNSVYVEPENYFYFQFVSEVIDCAAGYSSSAVIFQNGSSIALWGKNIEKYSPSNSFPPTFSVSGKQFSKISCGDDFVVTMSSEGQVYSAGNTLLGRLGRPGEGNILLPLHFILEDEKYEKKSPMTTDPNVISCGRNYAGAVRDANIYLWGYLGSLKHSPQKVERPVLLTDLADSQIIDFNCGENSVSCIMGVHGFKNLKFSSFKPVQRKNFFYYNFLFIFFF